jgi:hypothetical protein
VNATANRIAFVRWVRREYPQAYEQAAARALALRYAPRGTLSDLTESVSNAFDSFTATLNKITPAYTQFRSSLDTLKSNVERVRNGLPPIDPKTGQPLGAQPAPPANSPAAHVEAQIATDAPKASSDIPVWVWVVGAFVLGHML